MELGNHLSTDNCFNLRLNYLDEENIVTTGSNFLAGNGYLGYRGTLAEWRQDKYVACIVTDTYDMADDKWRELCNVPNGLYSEIEINGKKLDVFTPELEEFNLELEIDRALIRRYSKWDQGRLITERMASYDNHHLLAMSYKFIPEKDCKIKIKTGIDSKVWNLNGEHLTEIEPFADGDLLAIKALTREKKLEIDVLTALHMLGKKPVAKNIVTEEKGIYRELSFSAGPGETIGFTKYVIIYTGNDVEEPYQSALRNLKDCLKTGYEDLKKKHIEKWQQLFNRVDINIEGDPEAQTILRFNLYHNIIATPIHSDRLPIGARGLSCQAYQGAAFWDQEIFNLPMFLYTRPEIARNILKYRYYTLQGARQKARNLGYRGAFYAWISGKTGEELCPSYFFKDVISGRKIHNHFNDWQIHVSPDIAYTVWQYYLTTGDWDFITEYGAEIVFEVTRFLYSHAYFKKDKNRYEFIRLLGPDEYHENVDNNAYTNYMAQYVLDKALEIYSQMRTDNPHLLDNLKNKINLTDGELADWQEMKDLIYLPQPDNKTKLIEQFDGYFELEDVTPGELEKRLIDPQEYWGWPNGVAVETQVIKQADVVQLFCLLDRFEKKTREANFDYYLMRTEHGSSLSPSAYAIIAAQTGKITEAYQLFMESATIDLFNTNRPISGGTFIGGIHTAACGASWQVITTGFAGFKVPENGPELDPKLPPNWHEIEFNICYHGQDLQINITQDQITIRAAETNQKIIPIQVRRKIYQPEAGDTISINYG